MSQKIVFDNQFFDFFVGYSQFKYLQDIES